MQKVYYSQDRVNDLIKILIAKLKDIDKKWDVVVGIANGGLNISLPIAKEFSLPHIPIRISWYDGDKKRKIPLLEETAFKTTDYSSCLIVDDLVDHGGTLLEFERKFGLRYEDDTAVLLWNNKNHSFVPDFYAEEKPDSWVVFYWEKEYGEQ